MGKQNPYCAARLGKEAKKTETDKRGGQTPKWFVLSITFFLSTLTNIQFHRDQEIRFTVHDSPDYYHLKISVFNEDKRSTDLVGEEWVDLTKVIVPGGGKNDLWQSLNFKGKYAGELRLELTYYDSRQKPEKTDAVYPTLDEELWQFYVNRKVQRRPLPPNPNKPSSTPVVVPDRPNPGRAKHGPRNFQTPGRSNSMPPEDTFTYPHSHATLLVQKSSQLHPASSPLASQQQSSAHQYYNEYDRMAEEEIYEDDFSGPTQSTDFLPQLPPSSRQRASLPTQPSHAAGPPQAYYHRHPPSTHSELPHAHSAPISPMPHENGVTYDGDDQWLSEYPEEHQDVDYYYEQNSHPRHDSRSRRNSGYNMDTHADANDESEAPPPPPVHSNSAPAVPYYQPHHSHSHPTPSARYGSTPPAARPQFLTNSSTPQSTERRYGEPHSSWEYSQPTQAYLTDGYSGSPNHFGHASSTPNSSPAPAPSHYGMAASLDRMPHRHSMVDVYTTPPRPHPLSQEVQRARSPNPYYSHPPRGSSPYPEDQPPHQQEYWNQDAAPLIKPRAISPRPSPVAPISELPPQQSSQPASRPRSSYSIQHPVRAFESSDDSPLSKSQPRGLQPSNRSTPTRKSISPRPSLGAEGPSPVPFSPFSPDSFDVHNPNHQARSGSEDTRSGQNGPIVGWHGQEIDPSDHLPVDSWAPEPVPKVPSKTYGLGRERDFGPRTLQNVGPTGARISRDTVVNVRMKNSSTEPRPPPVPTASHPRLANKKNTNGNPIVEPLRDHENFNPVPNPYASQDFSRNFKNGSPGIIDGRGSRFDGSNNNNNTPPSIPPKIPLQQQGPNYGPDALTREISNIDIGTSRHRPVPSPAAYMPVRTSRDRNSFY